MTTEHDDRARTVLAFPRRSTMSATVSSTAGTVAGRIPSRIPSTPRTTARPRPAAGPSTRPASGGHLRLTRRGRVVVTLLLLGLVLGAAVLFGGTSVATGDAGADVPT